MPQKITQISPLSRPIVSVASHQNHSGLASNNCLISFALSVEMKRRAHKEWKEVPAFKPFTRYPIHHLLNLFEFM